MAKLLKAEIGKLMHKSELDGLHMCISGYNDILTSGDKNGLELANMLLDLLNYMMVKFANWHPADYDDIEHCGKMHEVVDNTLLYLVDHDADAFKTFVQHVGRMFGDECGGQQLANNNLTKHINKENWRLVELYYNHLKDKYCLNTVFHKVKLSAGNISNLALIFGTEKLCELKPDLKYIIMDTANPIIKSACKPIRVLVALFFGL